MEPENSRAEKARKGSPFLSNKEAAHYLRLASRSLEKMRYSGCGPRFRKHGRYVRYHIDDLNLWSEGHQAQPAITHDQSQSGMMNA